MRHSKSWYALQREATFAAESMASGISILRKADHYHTAHYLQAFFRLATGLERSGKLALCLDNLRETNEFPSNTTLTKYKHNLSLLLSDLNAIGCGLSQPVYLPSSVVHKNIITILSDFANNITRYHYLDVVTRPVNELRSYDPIARWFTDVTVPLIEDNLSLHKKQRLVYEAGLIDDLLDYITLTRYVTEALNSIETIGGSHLHAQLIDHARPYVRVYTMQICRFVAAMILSIENEIPYAHREHIPVMTEIFQIFLVEDAYIRRRKTWSIYIS